MLLLWQEGVSTAFGFGNQGLTANLPLFWTGYTQLKGKHTELRAPCPETMGISQRENELRQQQCAPMKADAGHGGVQEGLNTENCGFM